MNIGLFGGAFDPPHLGHQRVADTILKQGLVDEVWFVPVYEHPWAKRLGKELLSAYEHRLEMLKLVIGGQDKQKLEEFCGVSYTYDTLIYFSKKFPQHKFIWIMGSEYLPKFDDFLKGHPRLIDSPFLIYPRAGFPLKPLWDNMTALEGVKEVNISSTKVRQMVGEGKPVGRLVGLAVEEYVGRVGLYGKSVVTTGVVRHD